MPGCPVLRSLAAKDGIDNLYSPKLIQRNK